MVESDDLLWWPWKKKRSMNSWQEWETRRKKRFYRLCVCAVTSFPEWSFLHGLSWKQHEKWTRSILKCIKLPLRFNYTLTESTGTPFRIFPGYFNPFPYLSILVGKCHAGDVKYNCCLWLGDQDALWSALWGFLQLRDFILITSFCACDNFSHWAAEWLNALVMAANVQPLW